MENGDKRSFFQWGRFAKQSYCSTYNTDRSFQKIPGPVKGECTLMVKKRALEPARL